MGTVVNLLDHRDRRAERERALVMSRSRHPSLRWVAGDVYYLAHRKTGQAAACGAEGQLVLAPPGVPLCPTCYPPTGTSEETG